MMTDNNQGGRGTALFFIAAAAIVIATGAMIYVNKSRQAPAPDIEVTDTRGTVQRAGTPPPPAATQSGAVEAPPAQARQVPAEPLPSLDGSDEEVRKRLLDLAPKGFDTLLVNDALLRKFVVLVDNIARGKLAPRYNPLNAPPGTFTVIGSGRLLADTRSFKRYDPYADALAAMDPGLLVNLYWRYYPLLQQAYVDLGYPRAQFHPRMLAALDMLIAAPVMPGDAELIQPKVLYQYADSSLEALPAAQKQLMRMGPDNQARVQQQLKALRAKLAQ